VVRVIAEWGLIALAAAIVFGSLTNLLGISADPAFVDVFGVFRGIYRFAIPGLLLVLAHGFLLRSRAALSQVRSDLQAEESRREWLLANAQEVDRKVAEVLHRTVQGRLSAALILIRLGRRDEAWPHVVDMASIEVPRLLSDIQGFRDSRSLMSDDYPGLTVHMQGTLEGVGELLVADLRAVASEIAVNAQRHGGAMNLEIHVLRDEDSYTVRFCDDGRGLQGECAPGLGSRLLDEIVARHDGDWSISSDGRNGCCVDVRVPVTSVSFVSG
jgi:signal transduction histidine kinase